MTVPRVHPCRVGSGIPRVLSLLFAAIGLATIAWCQNSPQAPQGNPATAQTASANPPARSFDLAAIHQNKFDHSNRSHILYPGDNSHFRAINATAMQILQWAWDLPDSRILGAPGWLTATRFDIDAQSDSAADAQFRAMTPDAARAEKRRMVQTLLRDRFRLAAHIESRNRPVYTLVIARGGPRFSPVEDAPKHIDTTTRSGETTITITSSSKAMADLAEILYRYTGRVVLDKTALSGNYTLELHFTSDDLRGAIPASNQDTSPVDSAPSIFTALKEQLGLVLKPAKAPVSVLVIDHIELPTEN